MGSRKTHFGRSREISEESDFSPTNLIHFQRKKRVFFHKYLKKPEYLPQIPDNTRIFLSKLFEKITVFSNLIVLLRKYALKRRFL